MRFWVKIGTVGAAVLAVVLVVVLWIATQSRAHATFSQCSTPILCDDSPRGRLDLGPSELINGTGADDDVPPCAAAPGASSSGSCSSAVWSRREP